MDCGGLEGSYTALAAAALSAAPGLARPRGGSHGPGGRGLRAGTLSRAAARTPMSLPLVEARRPAPAGGIAARSAGFRGAGAAWPGLAAAAGVGSDTSGSRAVVVASQRAALTPVRSPEYFGRPRPPCPVAQGTELHRPRRPSVRPPGGLGLPAGCRGCACPGEFALRGEVLDRLHARGRGRPARMVFEFDVRSRTPRGVRAAPTRFPPSPGGRRPASSCGPRRGGGLGRRNWRRRPGQRPGRAARATAPETRDASLAGRRRGPGGVRGSALARSSFFPLAFDRPATLFDYLPADAVVFLVGARAAFRPGGGDRPGIRGPVPQGRPGGAGPPPETQLRRLRDRRRQTLPRVVSHLEPGGRSRRRRRLAFGSEPSRSFFGNVTLFQGGAGHPDPRAGTRSASSRRRDVRRSGSRPDLKDYRVPRSSPRACPPASPRP
ncbi:MAG: hypothetical protein M0C28_21840 [Candidatus Moduliflexus flocculans]|nr:hypothetical protein [Candidatus Moduliflexus flocculans]